jgi:hypothetical protein
VPLITGLFPLLLVLAARRKAEYVPGRVIRILGQPVVATVLLGLFIVALLAHGLVIWEGPLERAAAIAMSVFSVGIIVWVWRSGAFRPRAVVEVRRDHRLRRTILSVTVGGASLTAEQSVDPSAGAIATSIPNGAWRELRVWPHEVSDDGWSTGLPADVELEEDGQTERVRLAASDDPHVLPIGGLGTSVMIRLGPEEPA